MCSRFLMAKTRRAAHFLNILKLLDTFSGRICEQRITIIKAAEKATKQERQSKKQL